MSSIFRYRLYSRKKRLLWIDARHRTLCGKLHIMNTFNFFNNEEQLTTVINYDWLDWYSAGWAASSRVHGSIQHSWWFKYISPSRVAHSASLEHIASGLSKCNSEVENVGEGEVIREGKQYKARTTSCLFCFQVTAFYSIFSKSSICLVLEISLISTVNSLLSFQLSGLVYFVTSHFVLQISLYSNCSTSSTSPLEVFRYHPLAAVQLSPAHRCSTHLLQPCFVQACFHPHARAGQGAPRRPRKGQGDVLLETRALRRLYTR